MSVNIREQDKLTDNNISDISLNWYLSDEEELPVIQKVLLFLLEQNIALRVEIDKLKLLLQV